MSKTRGFSHVNFVLPNVSRGHLTISMTSKFLGILSLALRVRQRLGSEVMQMEVLDPRFLGGSIQHIPNSSVSVFRTVSRAEQRQPPYASRKRPGAFYSRP